MAFAPLSYSLDVWDGYQRRVSSEVDLSRIPMPTGKKDVDTDLLELAQRRERLLNRSKNRSALNIRELRKVDVDYLDVPERELYEDTLETKVEHHTKYLGRTQSLLGTEWDTNDRQNVKTRSQTNLASWQFSNINFSPRSVISVNGHQDDPGLLRIRTDLSPAHKAPIVFKSNAMSQTTTEHAATQQQQPQFWPFQAVLVPVGNAPISTITREVKEEKKFHGDFDRYSSEDNDSKQSTLIKIKDETSKKPKGIIKKRGKEIVSTEQFEQSRHEKVRPIVEDTQVQVQQVVPKVTETVNTVEETKRTEEVERKVERKEKKEKRSKKKGESRERRHHSHHHSSSHHGHHGPRPGAVDYPPWTVPFGEYVVQSSKMVQAGEKTSSSAQTDLVPYVSESPQSPWRQQHAITGNGHVQNGQGYVNDGYPAITERYQRQTTTKRVQDNASEASRGSRQAKLSEYRGGRDTGHALQNGDAQHHREGYRYNQSRERVHKSHSSNNVYHNELPEDFGEPKPIVEFPPTLQRGDDRYYQQQQQQQHHQQRNMHKTRSVNDWQMEPRYGRRWEADISGPERDYRDSLLMPMPPPGQNINEREYREEHIPGGHESFSRETKAHSGSRNDHNATTHFSESKQDIGFKRHQTSNGRY